jgi:nucleotide-binding universal stress UspA family protein
MSKKILVPTDGSTCSRRALQTAMEYAKLLDSEIEMLCVVETSPDLLGSDFLNSVETFQDIDVDAIGQKVFDFVLEGVDTTGVKLTRNVIKGHPATEIIGKVDDGFGLVVIGIKGHGKLGGTLTGSVTRRVLVGAPCPVLVVK